MELACPECRRLLEFQQVFDAAFCWAGHEPAVAFRCAHCGQPAYFGPRPTFVEVGFIGAGPTIDPVPMEQYPLVIGVARDGQYITLDYEGRRRTIPSANLYALEARE